MYRNIEVYDSVAYEHPLVKEGKITERAYQINIAEVAKRESTLVVLPTGLGKTIVAFIVMAENRLQNPDDKQMFLAPTKPLVNQHARDIEDILDVGDATVFTGEVRPDKRGELWQEAQTIVSTPQVIRNDIMAQRIDLDDLSLLVFDEAHRAVGGYAYVYIGERYQETGGLTMGLTASPGSEIEHILSVCETLGFQRVEIRTKYDPDVVNYVQKMETNWIDVRLPSEQRKVVNKLKALLKKDIEKLQDYGFLKNKNPERISRKKIIEANKKIQGKIHSEGDSSLYNAASIAASALKIDHAVDQAETQGPEMLREYLDKLKNEADATGGTKAAKRLMKTPEMAEVLELLKDMDQDHPKVPKTIETVKEQFRKKEDSRVIVFTNYRSTARKINRVLAREEKIKPVRFVGQTDKKDDAGLKQSEQVEAIKRFEDGTYNVLVATSVGEEGLDIPSTDLVVFYEPVPSEIRTIQRRGRTAREREGKVAILITKKTRDEAYYWSSKNKEKKMSRNLNKLKERLEGEIRVGDPMKTAGEMMDEDMDDEDVERKGQGGKSGKGGMKEEGGKGKEGLKVVGKKSKKQLKKEMKPSKEEESPDESQRTLGDFEAPEQAEGDEEGDEKEDKKGKKETEELPPEVTIDSREQNSRVVSEISKKGIKINTSQLSIGDYIISENTVVERKSVEDFLESITDGRLFSQARSISEQYINPIIILEGEGLHSQRNINDNAIYGALASLAADFQIPALFTKDGEETASLIATLVKRKSEKKGTASVRKDKRSRSTRDTKRYILEGLPSISGTLAERLLEHFGSVREVFQAQEEELQEVKGIGPETAKKIIEILD